MKRSLTLPINDKHINNNKNNRFIKADFFLFAVRKREREGINTEIKINKLFTITAYSDLKIHLPICVNIK